MATTLGSLIGRRLPGRRGFGRDDRGTTAIEFGLLAVPFFSIIAAILETSVVFLTGQLLESAVQDASRLIRTGQARTAMATKEAFNAEVCDKLFGLVDCSGLFVDVKSAASSTAVTASAPIDCTSSCDGQWSRPEAYTTGQGSSVMTVQVYYQWPVIVSFGLGTANLPNNKRLLSAVSVFRNEPFT